MYVSMLQWFEINSEVDQAWSVDPLTSNDYGNDIIFGYKGSYCYVHLFFEIMLHEYAWHIKTP